MARKVGFESQPCCVISAKLFHLYVKCFCYLINIPQLTSSMPQPLIWLKLWGSQQFQVGSAEWSLLIRAGLGRSWLGSLTCLLSMGGSSGTGWLVWPHLGHPELLNLSTWSLSLQQASLGCSEGG